MTTKELTQKQKSIRYAISVDFTPTNENFLDIVKGVYLHCGYDKNW